MVELKPSAALERLRGERWGHGLRKRPHGFTIAGRYEGFEGDALLEVIEERVKREMLSGDAAGAFPPDE